MAYAKNHGLDTAHWRLVTGSREEIFHIGRDVFKADGSPVKERTSFTHTRNVYLLDRQMRVRGVYDTVDEKALKNLTSDIAAIKAEKT